MRIEEVAVVTLVSPLGWDFGKLEGREGSWRLTGPGLYRGRCPPKTEGRIDLFLLLLPVTDTTYNGPLVNLQDKSLFLLVNN